MDSVKYLNIMKRKYSILTDDAISKKHVFFCDIIMLYWFIFQSRKHFKSKEWSYRWEVHEDISFDIIQKANQLEKRIHIYTLYEKYIIFSTGRHVYQLWKSNSHLNFIKISWEYLLSIFEKRNVSYKIKLQKSMIIIKKQIHPDSESFHDTLTHAFQILILSDHQIWYRKHFHSKMKKWQYMYR